MSKGKMTQTNQSNMARLARECKILLDFINNPSVSDVQKLRAKEKIMHKQAEMVSIKQGISVDEATLLINERYGELEFLKGHISPENERKFATATRSLSDTTEKALDAIARGEEVESVCKGLGLQAEKVISVLVEGSTISLGEGAAELTGCFDGHFFE